MEACGPRRESSAAEALARNESLAGAMDAAEAASRVRHAHVEGTATVAASRPGDSDEPPKERMTAPSKSADTPTSSTVKTSAAKKTPSETPIQSKNDCEQIHRPEILATEVQQSARRHTSDARSKACSRGFVPEQS